MLDAFVQDLRFGARMLLKNPGFTLVAMLTLAVGIGGNTAVFSFINHLFLKPVTAADPERVVRVYERLPDDRFRTFSYPDYVDLRDRSEAFTEVAAHQYTNVSLGTGDGARDVLAELVTGNYFPLLAIPAAHGRMLAPDDDVVLAGHPVAVISHRLWRSRFGGDPRAVGGVVQLNGNAFTVIGVAPRGFSGSADAIAADLWAPMMMHEQLRPRGIPLTQRGWGWLNGTARLAEGVSLEQARADVNRVSQSIVADQPTLADSGLTFELFPASPLPEQFRQGASGALAFFMIVVSLVLLVACANLAGVLMVKVLDRRREIAVRQSLGAGRRRLVGQWLTESLLVSMLGGAAGLLFALWMTEGIFSLVPREFASMVQRDSGLDGKAFAFAGATTLLTAVLFGAAPAFRVCRLDVASGLKDGAGTLDAPGGHRLHGSFIVAEVAVSLVLLITTGLLLGSVRAADAFQVGFDADDKLLVSFNLRRHGYDLERARTFRELLADRLESVPGVVGVTYGSVVPLGQDRESLGFQIPGHEQADGRATIGIANNFVGPGYFGTMGIRLLRGRDFEPGDERVAAPPVAVINETMARRYWPDADPLGRTIRVGQDGPYVEIVGVARDIKYYSLGEDPRPYVYLPWSVSGFLSPTFHVRTSGSPSRIADGVRQAIISVDPDVAPTEISTLAEVRRAPLYPTRALGAVSSLFGTFALALTTIGIYGLVSQSVSRRTREIGIRVALGAERTDILLLIVGRGAIFIALGLLAGIAASLGATRFLSSLLFGVTASEPGIYLAVSAALVGVALAACYLPARWASRLDPAVALRRD